MTYLLHIETSDRTCSVALSEKDTVVDMLCEEGEKNHAAKLTVLIDSLLKNHHLQPEELSAVAVSKGPGSYTGLRIGVSAAKGICYALDIPLIGVNTLYAMAWGMRREVKDIPPDTLFCPMIDARRMEVYHAVFNKALEEIIPPRALVIDSDSFSGLLQHHPVVFFGSGADKCKKILPHPNALFYPQAGCLASFLAGPAYRLFTEQKFESVAYFEPFYLKDFVATKPSRNLLSPENGE